MSHPPLPFLLSHYSKGGGVVTPDPFVQLPGGAGATGSWHPKVRKILTATTGLPWGTGLVAEGGGQTIRSFPGASAKQVP